MQSGDIGFARTNGFYGHLIRLGEWLKLRKSEWNHMFIVDCPALGGDWYLIQATLQGVTHSGLLSEIKGSYITMAPPCDREKVLQFARKQVGTRYSFLTILSIAFDILSWNWVPSLMNSYRPSWICSGLACESLRYGGWLHEWTNVYLVTPQQAYDILVAVPVKN